MSIQLTDDDLGKKFRTREGKIVTLERTPVTDATVVSCIPTHPYCYRIDHAIEPVRTDGGWLFEENDRNGNELDIVARVEYEPVRRNCIPLTPQDDRGFVTKDSGERQSFDSGMVRDTTAGKTQWHRVADGPMLRRWAELLTRGAEKYPDVKPGQPNWTLAAGDAEWSRFRESAFRHFMLWYFGVTDEDHAAAVMFNINGAEYVLRKSSAASA